MRLAGWKYVALLAALTATGAASAVDFVRRPHLNSVGQTSAAVVFHTDASCAVTVRYGSGGKLDRSATGAAKTAHSVQLTGLTAGTPYSYQVEACGTSLGDVDTFTTAPASGDTSIHFAVNGDMGTGGSQQKLVASAIHAAKPELMLTVGDNAYSSGTASEYTSNFFKPMAELLEDVPVFPTSGNHEYYTSQAQPYLDAFTLPTNNPEGSERYYSFDWGPVHFVSVDTMCVGDFDSNSCDGAAHRAWLRQDLAATQKPWIVVFMHHPPWSSGEHLSAKSIRDRTAPVFEEFGVDMVFTGHDHNYERSKPMRGTSVDAQNGIPYIVIGSGGATLRAWGESSQPSWSAYRNNTDYGFVNVRVNGGTLTAEFTRTDGKVLDTLTLTKQVETPPEPALSVQAEPARGETPLQTLLVAQSNLEDAQFAWTLPFGQTATGAQVQIELTEPGDYTASVTATSASAGVTLTQGVSLQVLPEDCESKGTCPPPTDGGVEPTPDAGGGVATDGGRPPAGGTDPGPPDDNGCGGASAALLLPMGLGALLMRRRRPR